SVTARESESPPPNKPRSNVNQFGGSIGGPIIHNKVFFFGDFEEIRIVLPLLQSTVAPTTSYENYTLSQLATGGCDYVFVSGDCAAGITQAQNFIRDFPVAGPRPAEVPIYQTVFGLPAHNG